MYIATGEMETINAMALPHGLVPFYIAAEDEGVDDEIELHTLTNKETGIGIQIGGWHSFVAYDFYERVAGTDHCAVWFGKEHSSILAAMTDAITRYREKGQYHG